MEIQITKTDQVQIQYTVLDEEYTYMDILYFSPKEYEKLKQEDIDKLINYKYAIWKIYVTSPIPEPTKADKEAELIRLQREKTTIENKIAVLTSDIANFRGG